MIAGYLVARYELGKTPEQVVGRRIKTYGVWQDRREAEAKARQVLDCHPGFVTSVEPVQVRS